MKDRAPFHPGNKGIRIFKSRLCKFGIRTFSLSKCLYYFDPVNIFHCRIIQIFCCLNRSLETWLIIQHHSKLTCWGDNVRSFAVRGSFDDCQRLVKAAFMDPALRATRDLSSANSINLGRLLPQAAYHAATALAVWRREGRPASFVIPSGNLGNALACVWARHVGLPIGEIVLAHNANRTVPDFLSGLPWQPRRSIATLASAMDVGDPSNMERLRALYPGLPALQSAVTAEVVDDAAIRERIAADYAAYGRIWCPHTAIAAEVMARMPEARRRSAAWVIAATAHPAKFREIVEPLIGRAVPTPDSLARLYELPVAKEDLAPQLEALRGALLGAIPAARVQP